MCYLGNGDFYFKLEGKIRKYSKISLIAGGSGITPIYQVLIHLLDEIKKYSITLLFANKKEEDILLRPQLEKLR